MKRSWIKLGVVAMLVVLSASAAMAQRTSLGPPDWNRGQHKKRAYVYHVDLGGSAPTTNEVIAYNFTHGQMIVDTSNGDIYIMSVVGASTAVNYTKIETNGNMSVSAGELAATNIPADGVGVYHATANLETKQESFVFSANAFLDTVTENLWTAPYDCTVLSFGVTSDDATTSGSDVTGFYRFELTNSSQNELMATKRTVTTTATNELVANTYYDIGTISNPSMVRSNNLQVIFTTNILQACDLATSKLRFTIRYR